MWRAFWTFAALVSLFAGFMAWASANATFLFSHPRTKGYRVEIDRATGQPIVVAKVAEFKALAGQAHPKVQLDKDEYNFGIMDPLTMGKHDFVLKNVGTAPLKLTVGPTSCKCTVSGLDKREIAPGEQAVVTLEWNTGRAPVYSHSATIYTTDPDRKSLDVRVSGKVRMQLGADVTELVLVDVKPSESAVAECFLYSQVWDDFEIQSLDSKLTGLTWELTKVQPGQAAELEAKAIQRLRVTIPAGGLASRFADTLRMQAKVAGEEQLQTLDLPIQGNVLGRYTLYGGDIVGDAVQLGSIPWGRGKKTKLLIKIRDAELSLGDVQLEVTPSLLRAEFLPREGASALGLYDLHLELPAETAPCQFLGTPQGEVTIKTNHPRIGMLRFPVRFAVVEKRE
jgi:Protein of unknown function (DUF1573)